MIGFFKSMPRVEPRVSHSFPGDAIYQLVNNIREPIPMDDKVPGSCHKEGTNQLHIELIDGT